VGSTDAELRDDLAYSILNTWIDSKAHDGKRLSTRTPRNDSRGAIYEDVLYGMGEMLITLPLAFNTGPPLLTGDIGAVICMKSSCWSLRRALIMPWENVPSRPTGLPTQKTGSPTSTALSSPNGSDRVLSLETRSPTKSCRASKFSLFDAVGYFLFSGIGNIGDWATVVGGWQPAWAWCLVLISTGTITYFLLFVPWCLWELRPFLGRDPKSRLRRVRRLTVVHYLTTQDYSIVNWRRGARTDGALQVRRTGQSWADSVDGPRCVIHHVGMRKALVPDALVHGEIKVFGRGLALFVGSLADVVRFAIFGLVRG
jgi:hypothetical protein